MKILLEKRKEWILYVVFACIMIFLFSQKINFHEDELLSYNLANASNWFTPNEGIVYSPADEAFTNFLVSDGEFNFSNVWLRQSNDVHPPIYYVLLHIICTLFPGNFSIQYAAIINILFQLLTLAVLRAFLRTLISKEEIVNTISITYIICPGVLSITTFLRMYVCVMFWILLFTYVVFNNINKYTLKDYTRIGIITICGAMTHYYFIIYAFFLSLAICIWNIMVKNFKEVGMYVTTMVGAGGISILIFPSILAHMFQSGRGIQSIDNLKNSNLLEQIKTYFILMNQNLFGDMLILIMGIILIALIIKKRTITLCKICQKETKYICTFFALFGYFIFIAKSVPLNEMRYLSPIFAVTYAISLAVLYRCLNFLFSRKKYANFIYLFVIFCMLFKGWFHYDFEYLYQDTKEQIEYATSEGNDIQGICVYDWNWAVLPSYREISQMKSIIFYKANTYDEYIEKSADIELENEIAFFIVGNDANAFISRFLEHHPEYVLIKDNGQFKYTHSFYFKRTLE